MINYELVVDYCDYDQEMNTALVAMFTSVSLMNNMKPYKWHYEPFMSKKMTKIICDCH